MNKTIIFGIVGVIIVALIVILAGAVIPIINKSSAYRNVVVEYIIEYDPDEVPVYRITPHEITIEKSTVLFTITQTFEQINLWDDKKAGDTVTNVVILGFDYDYGDNYDWDLNSAFSEQVTYTILDVPTDILNQSSLTMDYLVATIRADGEFFGVTTILNIRESFIPSECGYSYD